MDFKFADTTEFQVSRFSPRRGITMPAQANGLGYGRENPI